MRKYLFDQRNLSHGVTLFSPSPVSFSHKRSNLSNVQTLERLRKTLFSKVSEGTGSGNEDCYGTFKKLVRNSDYSKSDSFKGL